MEKGTFAFISGSLCLDFVDTLGNRRAEPTERLVTPDDLDRWLDAAGLVCPFRKSSTRASLDGARALRDAVYRFGLAAIDNEPPESADKETINHWATRMPLRPTIDGGHITLTAARPIEGAMSTIAADAVELMLGAQRSRIRICPECRMVFVDTSRPGNRRWCSSTSGCGNRAKVRAHRFRLTTSS
jgi:predicted RNA-binding Zn ribbon-like protein